MFSRVLNRNIGENMETFSDYRRTFSFSRTVREEDNFERIQAHDTFVECCSFSPDGTLLATCSGDETLKVWHVESCAHVFTLHGHKGVIWSCEFNSDTTMLCSCSSDKTVRVWDISEQRELVSMNKHKKTVWVCKFCPGSNKTIASCSSDTTIIIWDYPSDVILRILEEHSNVVEDICFHPFDDRVLASCSRDKTIRIWQNYSSEQALEPLVLKGHERRVTSCVFSPISDEILVSCSADLTIRVWNTTQGIQLNVMYGHSNIIWKCAFVIYRGNFFLTTCSSDRSVRFWDPISGCELKKLVNLDSTLDPQAQLLCCAFSTSVDESHSRLAVTSYEGGLYIARLSDVIDDMRDIIQYL